MGGLVGIVALVFGGVERVQKIIRYRYTFLCLQCRIGKSQTFYSY